jgi:hypothetical protein
MYKLLVGKPLGDREQRKEEKSRERDGKKI